MVIKNKIFNFIVWELFLLELFNRWLHGYVAVPVIFTLDKFGFFDLFLEQECVSLEDLTSALNPNLGHFKAVDNG